MPIKENKIKYAYKRKNNVNHQSKYESSNLKNLEQLSEA